MLILTKRIGEALIIGDNVKTTILGVKGNQAEGKKSVMIDTLKEEFGITPKQVEKELKKMGDQLVNLSDTIETKFKELQEGYEW